MESEDNGVCAICLEPIDPNPQHEYFTDEPQINPSELELFAHGRRGTHYVHASCQHTYINDQEAKGVYTIKCILCNGNIGSPSECRDLIIQQNRPLWDRMARSAQDMRTSIVSYLPERRTVVMSGLVLASITAAVLAGHAGETGAAEVAEIPVRQARENGFNPFLIAMTWAIILGGGRNRDDDAGRERRVVNLFDPAPTRRRDPRYDEMGRYIGRGGTRKKMSRRRRGGARVLNGNINSDESLLEFLNIIAKLNEKNTEPYYVVLSNVERKDVISLLDSFDIDAPIIDARGYEKKLLYEESDDE